MEVTREEAIATAMIAKFVGREVSNVGSLISGQSKNITAAPIEVDKVLSQLSIKKAPPPTGPSFVGASVDGEERIIEMPVIEHPITESAVEIQNPFTRPPQANVQVQSKSTGTSAMARFLGKAKDPEPEQTNPDEAPGFAIQPEQEAPEILKHQVIQNDPMLGDIFEYLVKIDIKLTKIQKQLKKQYEVKTVKE